jgi:hypothetical protein
VNNAAEFCPLCSSGTILTFQNIKLLAEKLMDIELA